MPYGFIKPSLLLVALLLSVAPAAPPDEIPAKNPHSPMSFLDNGVIRVGINRNYGGAITWLSKSGDTTNLINSFDHGRQIQMSFYGGPNPYIPNGKEPAANWRTLGWNPIQCGDAYGNPSTVLELQNDGKDLFVRCRPMQWPLNNEPGDCLFESRLTLDGNTVHVNCKLINQRNDPTQYPARDQELPAIYTNGPWWKLMTYSGEKPFTHDAITQIPASFPWRGWNATENWAALVDDKGWGLGVWTPGTNRYIGGFAGKPGAGGPADNPTGYIAPLQQDILDKNIEYDYCYVLILGSVDEIRAYACDHSPHSAVPDYRFESDRQHWWYHDAVDTGWPIHGQLNVTTTGMDPYIVGPLSCWQASDAPRIRIEAAFDHIRPEARIRWRRFAKPDFIDEDKLVFPIKPDGEYHVYDVDLSTSHDYAGAMTGLRIDPLIESGAPGNIKIKSISMKQKK